MSSIPGPVWMLLATLMVAGCGAKPTEEATPEEETAADGVIDAATEKAAPAAEIATYSIPDLSTDLGKQLVAALGEQQGIVAARVDEEQGLFLVTFRPDKTDPAAMLAMLQNVSAGAALKEVAAANSGKEKKDCGGCPSKSKCPKSKGASAG